MATTRAQNAKIAFNVYNDKSIEAGSMEYAEEEATEVEDQEDDEDDQEDSQPSNNTHYDSDDSEESVNDSVEKDINKFKHTIPGIGSRFRLIKRIGEGENLFKLWNAFSHFKAHSLPYIKRKILATMITVIAGTLTRETVPLNGLHHL
jgi:hypothetical protein